MRTYPLRMSYSASLLRFREHRLEIANSCPKFIPCRIPRVKMPCTPDTLCRDFCICHHFNQTLNHLSPKLTPSLMQQAHHLPELSHPHSNISLKQNIHLREHPQKALGRGSNTRQKDRHQIYQDGYRYLFIPSKGQFFKSVLSHSLSNLHLFPLDPLLTKPIKLIMFFPIHISGLPPMSWHIPHNHHTHRLLLAIRQIAIPRRIPL